VLPCDARDEHCAYAGEVPARAKYTRTNSVERDVVMLENIISAPREDGNTLEVDAPRLKQDLQWQVRR